MFATQLSVIKTTLNEIKTDMKSQSGQPRSRVGITHNHRNCRYHKEGHQVEATRANTMGGSRRNKDWVP
eukprot:1362912-Ditylum_brightwellii.AAC.1